MTLGRDARPLSRAMVPRVLESHFLGAVDANPQNVQRAQHVPEGPGAGRLIGELAVRTRTGASILAVESAEGTQIDAPERKLAAGDRVPAIGKTPPLTKLRALLGELP